MLRLVSELDGGSSSCYHLWMQTFAFLRVLSPPVETVPLFGIKFPNSGTRLNGLCSLIPISAARPLLPVLLLIENKVAGGSSGHAAAMTPIDKPAIGVFSYRGSKNIFN